MTRKILKYLSLGLLGLCVAAFLLIGFLYVTRGTPVTGVRAVGDRTGPPAPGEPLFRETMELMTSTQMQPGHNAVILTNGNQTYPALFADLRAAQRTITMQIYYAANGALADSVKRILSERSRAGVRVLFLVDAFGASALEDSYLDSLRAGGVQVAKFRPTKWYNLHKVSQRAHLRVVVVDGRIGYTGGFGIDDQWIGDGRTHGWRDTNVRFTGPAVLQLQAVFASSWAEATGTLLTGDLFFPIHSQIVGGTAVAGLLHSVPGVGSTTAERFYVLTIAGARRSIYLTNAYVVPDDDLRRMLVAAARRGVDVRILLPGEKNDVKTVFYAARARYEELLAGGVRIYEYQPAMIHAKTLVVDGVWSTIGSLNFDNRSIAFNEESTFMALDPALGARMDSVFSSDLGYAQAVSLEQFRKRGWWERTKEGGANLLSRLL